MPAGMLEGAKRSGRAANVNAVTGQKGNLLHVWDACNNIRWLVDGGALLSIVPPTKEQKVSGPIGTQLRAANGTTIDCYGTVTKTITIGKRSFTYDFTIADVRQPLLGADFLAEFYLAPNHRDGTLLDLHSPTLDTLPATLAYGETSNPVNFVDEQNNPYYQLLDSFPSILTPSFTATEPKHGVRHHIPTTGHPVQSRARRLAPDKLAVAKAELDKLVKLGVAKRGKSEYASPLMVASKPDGGWRVCGDYRRLNAQTTDDKYPVRSLQDFTTDLHGKKIFSKIDLFKGYHQIPVADEDVCKTGVITPFGLYLFPRTPFGLKNAGQDFQRLMDEILGEVPRVFVYIDDILVASETPEQHLSDLKRVFTILAENGLVVNRKKCVLGQESLEFLGYLVNAKGIAPLPDRVEAIRSIPPPKTVKDLQSFLGMLNYYRRFIRKAAEHMFYLFEALKGKPKKLVWGPEQQKSFEATKEALAAATLLHHPRTDCQLAVTTDASLFAVGSVLEQRGPDGWEPLAYYSSKLQPNQSLWPPYDRELLGSFKSVRHFRPFIEGRPFTLYTDHQSLVPSMAKKSDPQTARQTYQLACISEYTTDIRYIEGKANVVADHLSRPPQEEQPQISSVHNPSEEHVFLQIMRINCILPQAKISASSPSGGADLTTDPTSGGADEPSVPSRQLNLEEKREGTPTNRPKTTNRPVSEESTADLNCVISAIGSAGIDLQQMARDQPLDADFRQLSADARTGLNFKKVDLGTTNIIVDVSNGPARPFVPFAWRRRVFETIHGLGHPGVERTRQAVSSKFVWPSLRQDVTKWARECIPCQRAKVNRHTVPPIGDFIVPQRRFQHINLDLVMLPVSNGFRYLLTAVDRFSRWPVAIPIRDITAESVADAFAHGWVSSFGVPASITTDRGSQFSSSTWRQLMEMWNIQSHYTTAYHPASNGLVERFHRRLKESLLALANDEPENWYWRLPCTLLAIRTTLKPDVGASPADMVYGEGLSVPGDLLSNQLPDDEQLSQQRHNTLANLRVEVARLRPVPTSAHRNPHVHIPDNLRAATHVFVRRGGIHSSLTTPYTGPYRVISREEATFKIALPGGGNEVVSIARLKPAHTAREDEQEADQSQSQPDSQSQSPPPPTPPRQRPQQNKRRHRQNRQTTGAEEDPLGAGFGAADQQYDPGEGTSRQGGAKPPAPPVWDPEIFDNQDLDQSEEDTRQEAVSNQGGAHPHNAQENETPAKSTRKAPHFFSDPKKRIFSRVRSKPNYAATLSAIMKRHLGI